MNVDRHNTKRKSDPTKLLTFHNCCCFEQIYCSFSPNCNTTSYWHTALWLYSSKTWKMLLGLVDNGSFESYISPELVSKLGIKHLQSVKEISMASTNYSIKTKGHVFTNFEYNDCTIHMWNFPSSLEQCWDSAGTWFPL